MGGLQDFQALANESPDRRRLKFSSAINLANQVRGMNDVTIQRNRGMSWTLFADSIVLEIPLFKRGLKNNLAQLSPLIASPAEPIGDDARNNSNRGSNQAGNGGVHNDDNVWWALWGVWFSGNYCPWL
ncbi:MAG: hypothetical protein ACYDH9_04375 [Limisphaerales bacterium]